MHPGGRPRLEALNPSGRPAQGSYSHSKLFVTTLAAAVARLWPDVLSNVREDGCMAGGEDGRASLRPANVSYMRVPAKDPQTIAAVYREVFGWT